MLEPHPSHRLVPHSGPLTKEEEVEWCWWQHDTDFEEGSGLSYLLDRMNMSISEGYDLRDSYQIR
jgi:hypothetical protein